MPAEKMLPWLERVNAALLAATIGGLLVCVQVLHAQDDHQLVLMAASDYAIEENGEDRSQTVLVSQGDLPEALVRGVADGSGVQWAQLDDIRTCERQRSEVCRLTGGALALGFEGLDVGMDRAEVIVLIYMPYSVEGQPDRDRVFVHWRRLTLESTSSGWIVTGDELLRVT